MNSGNFSLLYVHTFDLHRLHMITHTGRTAGEHHRHRALGSSMFQMAVLCANAQQDTASSSPQQPEALPEVPRRLCHHSQLLVSPGVQESKGRAHRSDALAMAWEGVHGMGGGHAHTHTRERWLARE